MYKRVFSVLLLLGMVSFGFSQAVGKLSGVVKDKTTGEALPGVNVVIQETFLGASTDVDGFFVVLNVPAGTYTVSFSYIGYKPVDVENVRVVADLTKRLDMDLEPTTIELDQAIVVIAERPFFETGATNTVRVLDAQDIERIPVKGVNTIVSVNAGVVAQDGSGGRTDNATINVRGGRGKETLFLIDGVPYNDLLFGNAIGTIPDAAIEQVSSQLGGFSAKYGSVQSGVVNITTRSGASKFFGGLELVSSGIGTDNTLMDNYTSNAKFGPTGEEQPLTPEQLAAFNAQLDEDAKDNYNGLDQYGYNQITAHLGGPVIPGNNKYTFFTTAEWIKTNDESPRSSGLQIPTRNIDQDFLPDNESSIFRVTAKADANITQQFRLIGSFNGSFRDARVYTHTYAKNNSFHNPRVSEDVYSGSLKLTHTVNSNTYWDFTARGKYTYWDRMDGFWKDDLYAYGDKEKNAEVGVFIQADGNRVLPDENQIFHSFGRVYNEFRKYEIEQMGGDLNFTTQVDNHLLEIGGTLDLNKVRFYQIAPLVLAVGYPTASNEREIQYYNSLVSFYGYDMFGDKIESDQMRSTVVNPETGETDTFEEAGPPKPIIAGAYIQDKIELLDFIINLGARWDYFDPQFKRLKDVYDPLGADKRLSEDDFESMPSESYISPRLGFAFPVTQFTVFHAQYGIFRQPPLLFDLYDSWTNLDDIEVIDGQGQNNGHLKSESTTSYEFGFKQQFGNTASLDLTAYYKNIKGLTNVVTIITPAGNNYITTANTDFGTVKGIAASFNLRKIGPLSAKIDYTLALNEGTGSSSNSSFTATFRNQNYEVPLAIAPLDYDQRHTLTANLDVRAGKGEGPNVFGIKLLENAGANFLISYNSGRPYTPVEYWDATTGQTLQGNLTEYVNTAYAEGIFRIDMRIDKAFDIGRISLVPYLWVQNLLDRENFNDVWRSTGKPDNTGFLNTPEGQDRADRGGPNWVADYKALERDPTNYGIPRLVQLGLRLKF